MNVRAQRLCARAAAAASAGQPRRALEISGMALNLDPAGDLAARIYRVRTRAWRDLGSLAEACRDARAACARDGAPESQALLGMALLDIGDPHGAVAALAGAVSSGPGELSWGAALGRAYLGAGYAAEAAALLRRAAERDPGDRYLRLDLARAYLASGRAADAEAELHAQLERRPDDADATLLLGVTAEARGDAQRAGQHYERALTLGGDRPDAHFLLAAARLRATGGRDGWSHYEWRQPDGGAGRRMGVPAWRGGSARGDDVAGKRIVIWSEQGYGDNLQFVRFIPLLRARGAKTIYLAPPSLVRLLRQTESLGEIVAREPPYPGGDAQSLVMSLPYRLGLPTPFGATPSPYLVADPAGRAIWRNRLGAGFKVALVWQGNPAYPGDGSRSMPLRLHVPLLRRFAKQVRFVSVQKNAGREQLADLPPDLRFQPPGGDGDGDACAAPRLDLADIIDVGRDAFVDTAAVFCEVDLVITTDTALAHLAGALGRPAWLLLGAAPEFRWGTEGTRTGWYPEMRLFRQRRHGDWEGVIDQVTDALAVASSRDRLP
jgi:hypothetical protein